MVDDDLDSIVKGAPPTGLGAAAAAAPATLPPVLLASGGISSDPLSHAPGSPSMIYLNLLVLEASLRAQFLELRARRRHHTFFLLLLTGWVVGFGYALFLAPREDGRGVGGSIYWAVEGAERVCLLGGVTTAVLVWATGIFDRGIRWPRRWLAVANRGLRGFNCKLVVVSRPWWAEALSTVGFFLTYGLFHQNASSSYRPVDVALLREIDREMSSSTTTSNSNNNNSNNNSNNNRNSNDNNISASVADPSVTHHPAPPIPPPPLPPPPPLLPIVVEDEDGVAAGASPHEEDLAPGGDYVKLLLLPKPFSAAFRENWEIYRSEYWDRENERRALIRTRIQDRDRLLARNQSPWFWWLWLPWRGGLGLSRPSPVPVPVSVSVPVPGPGLGAGGAGGDPEKPLHAHHLTVAARERRRRGSGSVGVRRSSVSSSRSPTPSLVEPEDPSASPQSTSGSAGMGRKVSSGGSIGEKRRKKMAPASTPTSARRPGPESRSVTPEISHSPSSPLARESSIGAATDGPSEAKTPTRGGSVGAGADSRATSASRGSIRER